MKVHAIQIPGGTDPLAERRLLERCSPARRKRAQRYRNPADARRTLAADLLIRLVIPGETGLPAEKLDFEIGPHGKPELPAAPDYFFNISHSGRWVVLATDDRPIGVDLEQVQTIDRDVARICFGPEELRAFALEPESNKDRFFYSQWTMKESFAKCLGLGLCLPFESFSIVDGIVFRSGRRQRQFFFRNYPLADGYELSVCARHDRFPQNVEVVNG